MSESNPYHIMEQEYRVEADRKTFCVVFEGIMRLENTAAYQPVAELIDRVVALEPPLLTLDLRKLELMNSSGINSLSKFLMEASKKKGMTIKIKAKKEITWQDRMLRNIQRVVPGFELEFD